MTSREYKGYKVYTKCILECILDYTKGTLVQAKVYKVYAREYKVYATVCRYMQM